jgi:cytochrome c oxidase subunit 3
MQFEDLDQQNECYVVGMWTFLVTEVMFFGALFCAYSVYRVLYPATYLDAHKFLDLSWGFINTLVLLTSSLFMALAVHAAQMGWRKKLVGWLIPVILLSFVFLGIKSIEYSSKFEEKLFPGPNFNYPYANQAWLVHHYGHHEGGAAAAEGGHEGGHEAGGENLIGSTAPYHGYSAEAFAKTEIAKQYDAHHRYKQFPTIQQLAQGYDTNTYAGFNQFRGSARPTNISGQYPSDAGADPANGGDVFTSFQGPAGNVENWSNRAQLFFSLYFAMTGLHAIHIIIGIGVMATVAILAWRDHPSVRDYMPTEMVGLYWHFVDIVWIFLFPMMYLIS